MVYIHRGAEGGARKRGELGEVEGGKSSRFKPDPGPAPLPMLDNTPK